MKKIVTLIAFIASFSSSAQTFDVDTIFKNGPLDARINLVFVGDGYQSHELDQYVGDVNAILDEIFNQSPFKEYKNYFNAFAIRVISNQSGATHPQTSPDGDCLPVPISTVDTYFGSTFDYANIHRLLVPTKYSALSNVLASHLPLYDQVFVVVNSSYYGGSGGFYATGSTHSSGKEVAIHEIGHSFAYLADEYWAGSQYATEKPNMTQQSNSSLVKWKDWIGVTGVGIYSHAEATSWKRPHQNCKMRYLNNPFCKVCMEAFVERIHSMVQPLVNYSPNETALPVPETGTIDFSLSLVKPQPNTLKITWERDHDVFAKNQELVSIPANSFDNEETLIRATVVDTTELTRSSTHETSHLYVVEWTVGEIVTDISVVERNIDISVYPNPTSGELNISYTLDKPTTVRVSLLDASGKKIKTLINHDQPAGEHQWSFKSDSAMQHPGSYLLKLDFDRSVLIRKLVKE
jgi:hypothetical protein